MSHRQLVTFLMAGVFSMCGTNAKAGSDASEKLWLATYDARQKYFEKNLGPFPKDILKMANMTGVWPGGGLFVLPAQKLDKSLSVYTTFGLSNPDMPTTLQMSGFRSEPRSNGAASTQGVLVKKTPAAKRPDAAGYGYELLVLSRPGEKWPLNLLQWVVNAEIINDVGLLARVEKYDGLTVEKIDVGNSQPVNILISKARAPLPTGTQLPDGRMELLVATTITDEEMRWSQVNGRGALLHKLIQDGAGQASVIGRQSVVR
ncbi:suppressor of fused domain protein [Herbaspirillum sp.]|uniref:suppressor of fused domain protein n=1 Tax=Herbaspirillum sp. TaxID=1890675 RepID=UPI0031E2EF40